MSISKYYVYILRTSANTLYIGQTNNLEKRLKEHQSRSVRSAKYIRYFSSCELVYSEIFDTRSEAMKREWQLKKLPRNKKDQLVKDKKSGNVYNPPDDQKDNKKDQVRQRRNNKR